MEWWFFLNGFMSMMQENFPEPMSNHFTYTLLENIMNHLIDECEYQQEFVDRVMEIIPEIKEEEITQWFNR